MGMGSTEIMGMETGMVDRKLEGRNSP